MTKLYLIKILMAAHLFIFLSACDSSSFNPEPPPCEGSDCESGEKGSSSSSSQTSSSTSSSSSSSTSNRSPSSVSTPISMSTPSTTASGSGTSSSSGAGGFVSGGNSSGSSSGSSGAIEYTGPGGYTNYFAKINEPIDQQTSEKLPFAFKFVAVGKLPLKYTWYKDTSAGKQKLSSELTIFAKDSAELSDDGTYYATVEDADGNILTSRKARLKVNPERKSCEVGEYGPKTYNSQTGLYDYTYLVPKNQMNRTTGASLISVPYEIDGYAVSVSKCIKYYGEGNSCYGTNTLIQCQNGTYTVVSSDCSCTYNF